MTDVRIACARAVQKILEEKIFFGELKKGFSEKDLSFANMLILTALRRWNAVSAVLRKFVAKKIPHKHRLAEYLLKLAIAEILYTDTAPYAVIDLTVQNIKLADGKFLSGLANAVLRKVAAQKTELLQETENICLLPENYLTLLKGYSKSDIKQISESVKNAAPLDITAADDTVEWREKLGADMLPDGTLRIFDRVKVKDLCGYDEGAWWVQDAAAALPVMTAGNLKNKKVLDLCAAPGGKTAQAAAQGAEVTALDISESRLKTLKQNMQRLGFDNVRAICADAAKYMQNCNEFYDIVLLDAPCSASGTFRRHPEVLHIKSAADAAEQAKVQKQLLDLCPRVLKKGGLLIYSVCSVCKAEGEEAAADFLYLHDEFARVKITAEEISPYGTWPDNIVNGSGEIRTMPYYLKEKGGMDSFFVCKMQRII